MKLEYKIKGRDDTLSTEFVCKDEPSITITVDGSIMLALEGLEIESITLSNKSDSD
jgi:hypothetical protein